MKPVATGLSYHTTRIWNALLSTDHWGHIGQMDVPDTRPARIRPAHFRANNEGIQRR